MYYRYLLAGVIPLASVAEVFAEAPNILFILSDDHTSQTWGIYGGILADYAGADAPEGSQGRSFRDNLRGDTPDDWRTSIYYRYWTQHKERPAHIGVRTDRYKLIFLYGNRLDMTGSTDYVSQPSWEFYDLQEDPYEDHNAYNDPQYQNIIKQMKKEMMRLRTETGDTDASRPVMLDILRAQGL
ncbi:MAG: DUF4976 domain-containing protein [Bacteroidetes bacterium]|uniref:DUF4976 domain-containing protein n=1 Tax=Candidatus Cryptobacteroides faecipullorum TaxID=2840764 RepID=A0A9D9I6K5_9BACT|nr:DUF4976 domain-containing protein [Candidatus Cryptobacteroides faecipullorum]